MPPVPTKVSTRLAVAICLLVVCGSSTTPTRADYADTFNAYADGTLPAGWQHIGGPGVMAASGGTFAQTSTTFNNWCDYAYTAEPFGEGTYAVRVHVSATSWNNVLGWRWNLGGEVMQVVFNTSPLIPPIAHTRVTIVRGGQSTILADTAQAYTGLHDVVITDQGARVLVSIDGAPVFDVLVPSPLPAGYFAVNPGDWGTGGFYDDVHLSAGFPTPVTATTWGRIKAAYR